MFSEETEKRRLELISSAREALDFVLQKISEQLQETPVEDLRKQLLRAMIHRVNQGCASASLLLHANHPEDIWIIARSLYEVVVNILYLQFAEEFEVRAYMAYDSVSLMHQRKHSETINKSTQRTISRANSERVVATASAGKKASQYLKPSGWSKLGLEGMLKKIDERLNQNLFEMIYRDTYGSGNRYVHGNLQSLHRFASGRSKGLEAEGSSHVNIANEQIAQVQLALCIYLKPLTAYANLDWRVDYALDKLSQASYSNFLQDV